MLMDENSVVVAMVTKDQWYLNDTFEMFKDENSVQKIVTAFMRKDYIFSEKNQR